MPKPGWLKTIRAGLEFLRLARDQTTPTCPYEKCPLKLNMTVEAVLVEMSQDDKIRNQKELYKRNHPNG